MLNAHEIVFSSDTINVGGEMLRIDPKASGNGNQGEIFYLLNKERDPSGLITKRYKAGVDREVASTISKSFTTPEIFLETLKDLHLAGNVNYAQCKCLINAYTEAKALEIISTTDPKSSPLEYKGCLFVEGEDGYDVHLVMNALLMNENNNHVLAPTLITENLSPQDIGKAAIAIAMAMNGLPDNLIHRDIKPGNILWIERGNQFIAIVIDFATARIDGHDYMEMFNLMMGYESAGVLGSPGYMGPERMTKNIDGKTTEGPYTDTFSVGALLMKMLTKHTLEVKHNAVEKWTISAKLGNSNKSIADAIKHSQYPYLPLSNLICSSLELSADKRIYDRRIPLVLAGLFVNAQKRINLHGADQEATIKGLERLIEFTIKIGGIGDLADDDAVMASIMMLPDVYRQTLKDVMRATNLEDLPAKLRNGGRG